MQPLRKVLGRHGQACVLAALLLGAALLPEGPPGLRVRMAALYAPLGLLAAPGAPAAAGRPPDPAAADALRAENEALRIENASLREFRGVRFEGRSRPSKVVAGTILARDRLWPLRLSVLLDCGTADGVRRGQPVVAGRSLVGHVAEAGPSCCLVRLLDDPGGRGEDSPARVGVRILRPGSGKAVDGVLVGERRGSLRVKMIPAGSVAAGDLVVTSAADPRVPAGLLVGTVVSVEEDRRTRLGEAAVAPAADLSGLSTLLVLQLPEASLQASRGGKGK